MDTIRTFIAIELAPDLLRRIGHLQTRICEDVPSGLVRWVRPEGIHLTLKFLGEVPATQIEAIATGMQSASAPHAPFGLTVQGLGCFPDPRRPRVVWVGVEEPSGALARLQREVERAMTPLGFAPEKRRFSPHLTLGRVKGHKPDELGALGDYVTQAKVQVGEMEVAAVHLIKSELRPAGAVYTALAVAPLVGSA
jgi:2'-5' RNA ligase